MKREDLNDFQRIEGLLKTKLRAVKPNSGFVDDLRERLLALPLNEGRKRNSFDYAIWLVLGIGSSFLLITAGTRAVLSFASAVGLVHMMKDRLDEKQLSPQRTIPQ